MALNQSTGFINTLEEEEEVAFDLLQQSTTHNICLNPSIVVHDGLVTAGMDVLMCPASYSPTSFAATWVAYPQTRVGALTLLLICSSRLPVPVCFW